MRPFTATALIEQNKLWREKWKEVDLGLSKLTEELVRKCNDILRGRTRAGWPTREDTDDVDC